MREFMVTISFSNEWTQDFVNLIADQRDHVNKLFSTGKLLGYSLAADRSKLWVVMLATNEIDLLDMISKFPLINYMNVDFVELMFHNASANAFPPLIYN